MAGEESCSSAQASPSYEIVVRAQGQSIKDQVAVTLYVPRVRRNGEFSAI
jgi:hypothetical protein